MEQNINELFGFSSKSKIDREIKAQKSKEERALSSRKEIGNWKEKQKDTWLTNPRAEADYKQKLAKFQEENPGKTEEDYIRARIDSARARREDEEKYGRGSVSHAGARSKAEQGTTNPVKDPTGVAAVLARGEKRREEREAEKAHVEGEPEIGRPESFKQWWADLPQEEKRNIAKRAPTGGLQKLARKTYDERAASFTKSIPKPKPGERRTARKLVDQPLRKEAVQSKEEKIKETLLQGLKIMKQKKFNKETIKEASLRVQKVFKDKGFKLNESQSNAIKEKLLKLLLEDAKSMFSVSNESGNDISSIEEHLDDFLNYSRSKLEFTNPVSVKFISDSDNAQDTLGKTAFYDPAINEISLYVDNRHPKDVMRSLSHELVHHAQNCRGEFASALQIGEQGYAQKDGHLREMEREAYETGNMVFRDWEDGIKQQAPQVPLEEWKRNQLNSMLMGRMGLAPPEEDIDSFRCIVESEILFEHEEMTVRDAYALISQHPDSDRLLRLPLRLAMAEIEGEARPELSTEPPGMTDRGRELSMKTDWTRRTKPTPEVPEELEDVDVPLPPEEEVEAVAGEEGLEDLIPAEPEDEEEELPVKEWYRSQLNKKLMEGIKRG